MDEEKKTISDVMVFLSSHAVKLAYKVIPGLLKRHNKSLEKKAEKLENKKQALEENKKLNSRNSELRNRIKELKGDILSLKSFNKDKILKQFKDLVAEDKEIENKSNGIFKNKEEIQNTLNKQKNYINEMINNYEINARESSKLNNQEINMENTEALSRRFQEYESNIKMMVSEYESNLNYLKEMDIDLGEKIDFNKILNETKNQWKNDTRNREFSPEFTFDVVSEIEKLKKENILIHLERKRKEDLIKDLKIEKQILNNPKVKNLSSEQKKVFAIINKEGMTFKQLASNDEIKKMFTPSKTTVQLGKYDLNIVKQYFDKNNNFNLDNFNKSLIDKFSSVERQKEESKLVTNRLKSLYDNKIVSKSGQNYSLTNEGLEKLKNVSTEFEFTSYDANVIHGYISKSSGNLTKENLKGLLDKEYKNTKESDKQYKYLMNRLENNVKGGYVTKKVANGIESYSFTDKGMETRESVLKPVEYKLKRELNSLSESNLIKISEKKFVSNLDTSEIKNEKVNDLSTKEIDVDKYDFTNKVNPNYIAVEKVSNDQTHPDRFEFKGTVDDIKFFDDKVDISVGEIKNLSNEQSGKGEKVLEQFIELKNKGYLNYKNSDDFPSSKFEITNEGKKFMKEANFSNIEKTENKEIKKSQKVKTVGMER
ncbi:hypothetical protein [Clostridium akagii]|uniref:hypothetical protein n=1 Tax=Clostridium akagii TaxID=91623 RepID=UPI00047C4AA4|nr:hypothetical protein [Clostridium akagii]